jgi:E3 ubiquitin-protein ligase HUWE1
MDRTTVWQNILLRESVPKSWYANQPSKDAADLKDSRVINVRRFKVVLSEIPPALMPVLQAIIKVSVSRRPLSSSSKHSTATRAKLVARDIAQMFHTSLHYMEQDGPLCKYDYYASMFSMISMLLLDDRSRTALETPIAVAFDMKGNVEMLAVTLLSQFWQAAENEMKAENQDESLLQRINTCIELLLAILHHLGSSKLFHNSPHTVLLTHSQPDRLGKQLNPHHWMASMQLKLSCLCQYLESPMLDKFSRHVLHSLLKCVTQNLKAEGERPRSNKALVKNAPSNSNPHYEMNRRELIAMGFEPDRVETALSSFEYGLCALDNLFSRSLVEHPVQSGPPQLEISPDLQSSNPLTDQEFEAGVRILVNMWYDQSIATELLRENNNLAQTALTLSRYEPSAIRTPSIGRAVQEAPTEGTNNAEDDDDQYEDIDTEDEANVSLYSSMDEDEHGDDELNTLFAGEKNYAVSNDSKKANDTLQQLDQKRTMMRTQIPPILAHLVDERNDIDFEVRDLMAVLCCGDPDRLPENTKQTMYLFFGGAASTITDKRSLFESSINKIRIFALMLREPAMQDVMSLLITTMSGYMDWFDFLDLVVKYPDFPDPKWLTTLFLILEAGLAQSDEPVEAPLPNVDGSLPETSSHDKPTTPAIVTPENRTTLMTYCIDLLQLDSLSQDNLIATLRIIVRLTKHHAAALQFVELGGLEALFKRPSKSFEALKVQQTYIIMILRHIIENKSVLMGCMREWFSFWFTVPNTRYLDAATFIRNNNNVALRDPESFLDVSTQLCRLSNYNSGNIKNIRYLDPSQQKESVQESINNEHSSIVIHFLLNQLVQIQQENEDDDESNIKIAYTGFLLQCIFELVSSYQSCKYDIMNFSTEALDHGSNHSHVRQSIHYKLVNMLLPYNAIHASNDQERKKQGISMWVTSLLVGMCYDTTHIHYQDSFADKDHHATMLSKVRKHVLDVVYRSFKDALQSDASTSTKYNHYFALTELCHRILNARPTSINPGLNIKEDTVMVVAKLMLDMNFVPILISVMSDVDVNYPHAKLILNSILRPLEQLTKLAIRIDRSAADEEKQVKQETIDAATDAMAAVRAGEDSVDDDDEEEEEEEEEDYLPMDTDEDNADAEDEVNDLYRNSSLAMFDGTALEEEESSEEDSDDDMEMASSGDEVIDDSSESGDGFETVSSSEGEEAAEDQEMDDLMRSHRFHHSDTEEEDNVRFLIH